MRERVEVPRPYEAGYDPPIEEASDFPLVIATELGIDNCIIGKSRKVPPLFRPVPLVTPESMPEDARA
eukprot:2459420-Alexandrium_andersonii.AAC.1